MAELPSGTVTFLFTDVEGSTRLWEEHPGDMAPALARHDELLREAITRNGGYVFSTAGDAFAAAFATADSAVTAALDAQRALQQEDWPGAVDVRVRMGLHQGETVERDGDYFGPTLNRGARVMAAGHGAQVLLTGATADALGSTHRDGVELLDLGEHRLRDLDGTEHLYQVGGIGLLAEFPPVQSLDASTGTLPAQRSSFVGRDDEVARTRSLLHQGRLVTLTGAGGCGKTRLAIEAAARELSSYPDGTYFVDLAKVADDDGVASAFAAGLDFVPEADVPVTRQVRDRIGSRRVLLVVDNCEHLLDEVAEQLDELLAACPNARVLATSREALDVEGERTFRVPSLAVDAGEGRPASVRLFLERAAEAGTELGAADDDAVAAICRRLDGLPLAIELAAARTGVLTPAQILERLDDRFALLTGGRRRTRGRQQTLEAAIAWSYDLLEPDEQDALRRLSVMPGAFDLDLAAAVLGRAEATALDALDTLVARSLLQTERAGDDTALAYRLLETIRVYAYSRLVDAGDAEDARDRHAGRVTDRLECHPFPFSVLPEHDRLADDAVAALDWIRTRGDLTLGARLASATTPIFVGRGLVPAGRGWFEWSAAVDDVRLRSNVYANHAALEMIAGETGHQVRLAGLSLKTLGDEWAPWRARSHALRSIILTSVNPEASAEELRTARRALEHPETLASDAALIDMAEAGLFIWQRDPERTIATSSRTRGVRDTIDPTVASILEAGELLTALLFEPPAAVAATLASAYGETRREEWLERVARGEQWFGTYEVIRSVVVAALGDPELARANLGTLVGLMSADRLTGVDADFLGAFAMICWYADERDRMVELLDDTCWIARTPATMTLLMEAVDRSRGALDGNTLEWRVAEVARRFEMRAVIDGENRPRTTLDSELARLGLSP